MAEPQPGAPVQPCVLVVDDEPAIAEIVALKLGAAGFRTVVALNGAEALDWLATSDPDLVITDLQMPFVGGIELCRRLAAKESTRSVPVLLLTAHSSSETGRGSPNVVGVIRKPFRASQIVTRTIEAIGSAEADPRTGVSPG